MPVPEVEGLVDGWRKRHDPSAAAGVPAHITVLYPFIPPELIGRKQLACLSDLFSSVAPSVFQLVETRRFVDEGVIYLAPEPAKWFVSLTLAVTGQFPEWPPYEGRFEDIVPHLSIADGAAADILDEIEHEIEAELPVSCWAEEILLMVGNNLTGWDVAHRWRLSKVRSTQASK